MRILVTNDDGVHSPGLRLLYGFVADMGEVDVVAPESPKSATGLGITLHKPLRMYRVDVCGFRAVATSGTPSDTVYLAAFGLGRSYGLVLSGINLGENTSLQAILSSGTVGAAMQAALLGIPALAFSADLRDWGELSEGAVEVMRRVVRAAVEYVARRGMPRGADVVSINFPRGGGKAARLARAARLRYAQRVERRVDPRGGEYFWLYGEGVEPEEGTDVHVVLREGNIAVTPLTLDLNAVERPSAWEATAEMVAHINRAL